MPKQSIARVILTPRAESFSRTFERVAHFPAATQRPFPPCETMAVAAARTQDSYPLDLYAGIDHQGRRVLLLVVRDAPPNLPPPGIVEIV